MGPGLQRSSYQLLPMCIGMITTTVAWLLVTWMQVIERHQQAAGLAPSLEDPIAVAKQGLQQAAEVKVT